MASKQSLRADRGIADRAVLLGSLGLWFLFWLGLFGLRFCFWRTFGPRFWLAALGGALRAGLLLMDWQRLLGCLNDSFLGTPFGLSLGDLLLGGLLWLSFFLFVLWLF